ncbi:YnbE family lipoprotein [Zavarzinia compransoris]|uniref:YnbE family lipoprotein n=1 Tax=Zavarzinia marina TaxID=2911065 RepID=UPI001F3639D0|nr:YnbE family lipoprotein [Zavarzinia marina]MCF4164771.1 YnbE family lipoprotein [Zavarzinia marina]
MTETPGTSWRRATAGLLALAALAACTPRVEVAAPREPITINLNIKLDADVRLHIEEKAKEDVENNAIF